MDKQFGLLVATTKLAIKMKAEAKFQHVENTCLKSIALYSMSVHREIRITKRIKCPSQYIYIYIYIYCVCVCMYMYIHHPDQLQK